MPCTHSFCLECLESYCRDKYQEMMYHVQCVEMSSRSLRTELLICQSEHIMNSLHLHLHSRVKRVLSTAKIALRHSVETVAFVMCE